MINNQKVIVIIPARGGSQRLPRKNICLIWGKPMLYWAIRASNLSIYVDEIYLSTEDEEIAQIASNYKVQVIKRPPELAVSNVCKQDVIVHAINNIDTSSNHIIISLQPNSPEIDHRDMDSALEKFIEYDRNEIFTVDNNLIQNAAFRVMKRDYALQKTLSTRCGVFVTNYVDIHDQETLDYVEKNRMPSTEIY